MKQNYFICVTSISSIEGRIMYWMGTHGDKFDDHFIMADEELGICEHKATGYCVQVEDLILRNDDGTYSFFKQV